MRGALVRNPRSVPLQVFATVMTAGFATFGTNADGVILKNYSRKDALINAARLGMAFSIIASFPLMSAAIFPAKDCTGWTEAL